jgi:hypothetical protein
LASNLLLEKWPVQIYLQAYLQMWKRYKKQGQKLNIRAHVKGFNKVEMCKTEKLPFVSLYNAIITIRLKSPQFFFYFFFFLRLMVLNIAVREGGVVWPLIYYSFKKARIPYTVSTLILWPNRVALFLIFFLNYSFYTSMFVWIKIRITNPFQIKAVAMSIM